MRTWLAVLTVALLLAGCSSAPTSGIDDDKEEPEFGVKATESTGVIRGLALDEAIRPVAGVTVNLTGGASVVTGDDGAFGFQDLAPGDYFLQASKFGFTSMQSSVSVIAGEDEPPIVKMQLVAIPSLQPYVDALSLHGFLTFGAAVGATSIGTTIFAPVSEAINDKSIWYLQFSQLPMWAQGELVWDHTQAAGGMLIWEMTDTSNTHYGYRETTTSPALAYWNTTVLSDPDRVNSTLDPDRGIAYRMFGGPHPLLAPGGPVLPPRSECPQSPVGFNPCSFGFGLTVQQRVDAYIHNFYNFAPPEGWRFTVDGDPVVPPS